MSNEQEMREAFEKWVATKYHVYEGVFATKDGEYYRQIASKDENDPDADVQSLFVGYQAATLAAEARIRELEADAKRYRWWRKNAWFYRSNTLLQDCWPKYGEIIAPKNLTKEQAIDAAIDAAITEHKENQG